MMGLSLDLSGANLSEVSLSSADLARANLSGANLFFASLLGADRSGAGRPCGAGLRNGYDAGREAGAACGNSTRISRSRHTAA